MAIVETVEKVDYDADVKTASAMETILAELNATNAKLGQAVRQGDLPAIDVLTRELAMLEAERDRLLGLMREPRQDGGSYASAQSSRDRVVQLLGMTGAVSSHRLLADLSRAVFRSTLDTTGFSSLRRDELRAWAGAAVESPNSSGSATAPGRVYVVPALSYDRFVPVRGVLALSHWPVERRIVAPSSLRVDLLRAVIAVTERAVDDGETSPLPRVVAKFAHTLGVPTFQLDASALYQAVLNACRDELPDIEPADDRERARAARRAVAQLDERALLFGAQLAPLTDRGSRRTAPRKAPGATKEAS